MTQSHKSCTERSTAVSSVVSRNYVELCLARVSAGFAPGSEFRPVSLHTPGLATGHPCPDARGGRPSTAAGSDAPPARSGVCNGPSPVAFRESRRNPARAMNQPNSVTDHQVQPNTGSQADARPGPVPITSSRVIERSERLTHPYHVLTGAPPMVAGVCPSIIRQLDFGFDVY